MTDTFDQGKGVEPHKRVYADNLGEGLRYSHYGYAKPSTQPLILAYGTQAAPVGVPTLPAGAGVADQITNFRLGGSFGIEMQMHATTAQALQPLVHVSKGLEIALDQVDNECVEYVPGGNSDLNPFGLLAGTDRESVFIRAILEITTNNGIDQMVIGYRKRENYVTPTSFLAAGDALYTDFFGVGFNAAVASPNPVGVVSDIANGGSNTRTAIGFTVTSGMIVKFELRLGANRKPDAYINGIPANGRNNVTKNGVGAAIATQTLVPQHSYTFAAALQLVPFIFSRQDAGTSTVFLRELEVGRLVDVGLQPELRV